jgi:RNA polymerase sigma-70 factor (ECF subfamily)
MVHAQPLPVFMSAPRGVDEAVPESGNRSAGDEQPEVIPQRSAEEARAILEELFRSHHRIIWRTLRRLGASPEAAADFTQQAYVIAAERFPQIRPGCEKAFLFSTAIGLSRTSRRREARCQLEENMEVHARRMSHDEKLTRQSYARQLTDRVLSKLDPTIVTVFTLFELEGLTSPEISELLQVPVGTVASRLRRARQSFKAEVAALEGGKGDSNE